MHLTDLETPALVLDRNILDRNLARMREHLTELKVGLRPHVKTAKSMEVVSRALKGHREAITVSTLKEAEYFFSNKITDILYAVGIAPNKLEHVAALMKQGANMKILLA